MKVIIAAAGTAGHINPGIAIANKIKKEEPIERVEEQKKEEAKVNPRFLLYLGILFGGIVFLAIVGFIVSKIRNRKLNKMLDEL